MRIQGQYINVNGGQIITDSIEVKYKVESDKVLIKYYLVDGFDSMHLCIESEVIAMHYDDFGEELGLMPMRTRKYLPSVLFGKFTNVEEDILNKINSLQA
tara:strand:+ start:4074 stop:4373 length:300 start_codon:yes stop_codon:yes gene_type:complete